MEDDAELRGIAEVRARLEDKNPDLRNAIVRDLGSFTVALLCVSQLEGRDVLELGGTGTLVQFGDCGGILTAAHVWQKKLRKVPRIGITLKEAVEHKYLIDTQVVTPFVTDPPWAEEWGPDMAFRDRGTNQSKSSPGIRQGAKAHQVTTGLVDGRCILPIAKSRRAWIFGVIGCLRTSNGTGARSIMIATWHMPTRSWQL